LTVETGKIEHTGRGDPGPGLRGDMSISQYDQSEPSYDDLVEMLEKVVAENDDLRRQTRKLSASGPGLAFIKNNRVVIPPEVASALTDELNRRTKIIEQVHEVPHIIEKLIAFINGAVVAGRGQALYDTLFTKRDINGFELDRLGELAGLYANALSDWRNVDIELANQLDRAIGPVIRDYANALQTLKETNNSEPLLMLALADNMTKAMAEVRKTSSYGRPEYPETKELRKMKTERMSKYEGQWVKMGRDIVDSLKKEEYPTDLQRATLAYFEPLSNDRRKEILKEL
jgi:hypothetical protein